MKTWKFDLLIYRNFVAMISWWGIYSDEHMDEWEYFNEKSLPEKEYFYSLLNMRYSTHADYTITKEISKDSTINILGNYRDLWVQNNNMRLKIYEFDPASFLPPRD